MRLHGFVACRKANGTGRKWKEKGWKAARAKFNNLQKPR